MLNRSESRHNHHQHCHHNLRHQHDKQRHNYTSGLVATSLNATRWRPWLTLYINISLMIFSSKQADCTPATSDYLNRLNHEGLLVDLLNQQQSEFLSQLHANNQLRQLAPQQHFKSASRATSSAATTDTRWIPISHNENKQLSSSLSNSSGFGIEPQRLDPSRAAEFFRDATGGNQTTNREAACDRKRRTRNLDQIPARGASNVRINRQNAVPPSLARNSTSVSTSEKLVASDSNENVDKEYEGGNNNDDDDDDDERDEDVIDMKDRPGKTAAARGDPFDVNESVALESSIVPPRVADNKQQLSFSNQRFNGPTDPNDEDEPDAEQEAANEGPDKQPEMPDAEAVERREQEAAEASEAEAADRSALAEQQQQQREIILAQAHSEAKAIREQQEALLKQQQLQQQMLMRRHQNFLDDESKGLLQNRREDRRGNLQQRQQQQSRGDDAERAPSDHRRTIGSKLFPMRAAQSSNQQLIRGHQSQYQRSPLNNASRNRHETADANEHIQQLDGLQQVDNQFSDLPDNGIVDQGTSAATKLTAARNERRHQRQHDSGDNQAADELGNGEDSVNRPQYTREEIAFRDGLNLSALLNLTASADLIAAAQHHHYGTHYGSLDGHQGSFGGYVMGVGHHKKASGGYHQYAESHKKGQFDSGFKRGNGKFVISGHSSQHKGHADGHVKWSGKKGKGSHHWDYKHKNKKHYGGGYGYGGGHHYY